MWEIVCMMDARPDEIPPPLQQGSGFSGWGSGFRVQGLEFMVQGVSLGVQG